MGAGGGGFFPRGGWAGLVRLGSHSVAFLSGLAFRGLFAFSCRFGVGSIAPFSAARLSHCSVAIVVSFSIFVSSGVSCFPSRRGVSCLLYAVIVVRCGVPLVSFCCSARFACRLVGRFVKRLVLFRPVRRFVGRVVCRLVCRLVFSSRLPFRLAARVLRFVCLVCRCVSWRLRLSFPWLFRQVGGGLSVFGDAGPFSQARFFSLNENGVA